MNISFSKYQGTQNDFVIIDNRSGNIKLSEAQIEFICDRRKGIGADGLMLLGTASGYDFSMTYYNANGKEGSMCGNGGRCLVAFAKQMGVVKNKAEFEAVDGYHFATIDAEGIVALQMKDVDAIQNESNYTFLNTGSPHHVQLVNDLKNLDVKAEGAKIRYSDLYGKAGSNVNFVNQLANDIFAVRTYERGVEDETLSCGTGVTAVAIAMHQSGKTNNNIIDLNVEGGKLKVQFDVDNGKYTNVFLIGPATFVFEGKIDL
jgi:diaminopimelate epimerase